jgi:hypothetical protein
MLRVLRLIRRCCLSRCALPRSPRVRLAAPGAPFGVTAAGHKFRATIAANQHTPGRRLSPRPTKHDRTFVRHASKSPFGIGRPCFRSRRVVVWGLWVLGLVLAITRSTVSGKRLRRLRSVVQSLNLLYRVDRSADHLHGCSYLLLGWQPVPSQHSFLQGPPD